MSELPLFPLNTVLFPGTPLHLHIFEERYKLMIGVCLEERQPFGVVLIRQGMEALGPLAEPHPIGCMAHIIHVRRLEEGRLNLIVMGQERFRLHSVNREAQPYLLGEVEPFPLRNPEPLALHHAGARLRRIVERFVHALAETSSTQFDLRSLPEDPVALAYTAAAILQISPDQKQALLSIERADELVASLYTAYRREVTLLQAMISKGAGREQGAFSRN